MNVLVIPEDYPRDELMLVPIVKAMLKHLGKPKAKVAICRKPRLQGIGEALKWERLTEIIDQNGMVDLFLLCVDRDGIETRKAKLEQIERKAAEVLKRDRLFLAENAWQEIEVWVLAGHDLPKTWNWQTIRAEIHPKEQYFELFANQRGLANSPGQGRKLLAEEAAQRYSRIRSRCREDLVDLEDRIHAWFDRPI
ncbi:MAG: hypothetical protein H7Z11_14040 [Verrucomicrobia bacterium]|nr:hypothetical protein [Leptolyngbya sp. ES-bin-22]